MRGRLLALLLPAMLFAVQARAEGGSGGSEGHGGGDVESQFVLCATQIADYFASHPDAGGDQSGRLSLVDWSLFAKTAKTTQVKALDHAPKCLHQDGSVTPRDACFYKASASETAHVEVNEKKFLSLPASHQCRLVAHETFRELGMDSSDESYELSNAIFMARIPYHFPNERKMQPESAPVSIAPLIVSGVYQRPDFPCGFRVFRSESSSRKTVLQATLTQRADAAGAFCPARDVSVVADCNAVSCKLDFAMNRPVRSCIKVDQDGYCVQRRMTNYVADHYTYSLVPLESGQVNVLGTFTAAQDVEGGETSTPASRDIFVNSTVFKLEGLK